MMPFVLDRRRPGSGAGENDLVEQPRSTRRLQDEATKERELQVLRSGKMRDERGEKRRIAMLKTIESAEA